jgi:thymidylate synthase (FAD)
MGLRELINMSEQRMCLRAYHEFRDLMKEILNALAIYSDEWKFLVEEEKVFQPKCYKLGRCPEKKSCGRFSNGIN